MLDDRRQVAKQLSCEACGGPTEGNKVWGQVMCYPCFGELNLEAPTRENRPELRGLTDAEYGKRFRDWCHRWIEARRSKTRAA